MSKYIDADKFIEVLEEMKKAEYENCGGVNAKTRILQEVQELIPSLQQEQPELPPIGYAATCYQKGLGDGIIKGQMEILGRLEGIENRKAEHVLVIKEQDQPEVDLEKEIDAFFDKWDKNSNGCIFDENGTPVTIKTIKGVVKHFLNARKEDEK